MSDDQNRSNQGRFLNHEEDETPVPGPTVPAHFPNPSTGSRTALGGPTPFAGGQFPNTPTGQFGAAPPTGQFPNTPTGQFGVPASGQFPASSTGQFGAVPPTHFPNPSTGSRNVLGGSTPFGAPTGQFPNTPTGQFPNTPTGQFPNTPTGQFPNTPTGQFPNTPTGQFGVGSGQFPTSSTGQFGQVPISNPVSQPLMTSSTAPDTRMRLIYGGGGAGIGLLVGLLLGILNSGLEQMTFVEGLSVTIQMALWFMLLFGIACAFKPQRVEFILKKHGLKDS